MSRASEEMIAEHNARMETDEDYREQMYDLDRSRREAEWSEYDERQIDWFADYRIDDTGYEEFDEPVLDSRFDFDVEDLPF